MTPIYGLMEDALTAYLLESHIFSKGLVSNYSQFSENSCGHVKQSQVDTTPTC